MVPQMKVKTTAAVQIVKNKPSLAKRTKGTHGWGGFEPSRPFLR